MDKLDDDWLMWLVKWISGIMSAVILFLARFVFGNITDAWKKSEEWQENTRKELDIISNKIEKIADEFHAFKRQQEGVLKIALDDLDEARTKAAIDREEFIKFIRSKTYA